jgi:hypothetical protein
LAMSSAKGSANSAKSFGASGFQVASREFAGS